MTRYHKGLGVFLVTVFGLWGCARAPESPAGNTNNDKIKVLETKTAKLEDDLKSALAAKEQLRKKYAEAEEVQARLNQEIDRLNLVAKERDSLQNNLQARTVERDNLKGDLRARTLERDQLQSQFDTFRKNIKELLGQAEATTRNSGPNTTGLASRDAPGPALTGGGGN